MPVYFILYKIHLYFHILFAFTKLFSAFAPKQGVFLIRIRNEPELNNKSDPRWARMSLEEENFMLP